MGWKSLLIAPYAKRIRNRIQSDAKNALEAQESTLQNIIQRSLNTLFGKDHAFDEIKNHGDFQKRVKIRDYEQLRRYVDRIIAGEKNVLWPGVPKYFAKTSGTTSGVKYIPITKESVPNHIHTARNALFNHLVQIEDFSVFDGKMIFLSGSPILSKTGPVLTGRLSGIVNHEIPFWVKGNQLPSYATNCIDDWELKVEKIIYENLHQDLRLISGIPPWVQMYFEKLLAITGKSTVKEVYPNFRLFMFGGVNYAPYQSSLEQLIGASIDSIELYPASEGFIAFQDTPDNKGLLLNTNSGIYYEFVPLDEIFQETPTRLTLQEVKLEKDYALVISNNAGLWAYNLGDTVRFVSLDPYRIIVSGRIKHFISAFGEHVIGKEVEEAMFAAAAENDVQITEFTVAPQVTPPQQELPFHEWFVEFEKAPSDIQQFARQVDQKMILQNIYYKDLIDGNILQALKIVALEKGAFRRLMKAKGKLGGQNKVPRLSNDRSLVKDLIPYILKS